MNSTSKYVVITAMFLGLFATATPEAEAAPTLRSKAMASAVTQKGAKYVPGAEGGYSKGYDCSGLTYWSYKQHGKTLPRTAQAQYDKSKKISSRDRKPGDLIFIRDARGRVFHVGIYTRNINGKGYMVNANSGPYRGYKVVEAPIAEYTAGSASGVIGRY
jgi:cell wall-associated NlpC family hydrolase